MDQAEMQSKGIAPGDVLSALAVESVVQPSAHQDWAVEYDVRTNGSPRTVEGLANIPIKQVNGTPSICAMLPASATDFRFKTTSCARMGIVAY